MLQWLKTHTQNIYIRSSFCRLIIMRPNNNIITAQHKMVIEMRYQNIYQSIWSTLREIGIKFYDSKFLETPKTKVNMTHWYKYCRKITILPLQGKVGWCSPVFQDVQIIVMARTYFSQFVHWVITDICLCYSTKCMAHLCAHPIISLSMHMLLFAIIIPHVLWSCCSQRLYWEILWFSSIIQ